MYSDNVDLQRSASLTFAEITEHGWPSLLQIDLFILHIASLTPSFVAVVQMCVRSTETLSSPFYFYYRAPI